jgi:glucose/arabinose dehydrogenase
MLKTLEWPAVFGPGHWGRRILIIALAGGLLLIGGGAGVVGVCKLTSVECYYLLHGNPLEQTSGTVSLPKGFSTEVVASGLDVPTTFDFLPDGRILIGEKNGLVLLAEDAKVASTPVIDLRDQVNTAFYRGLMAVAVDPDFDQNRFVYVVYSAKRKGAGAKDATYVVVSRFVLSGGSAGGERVILGTAGKKTGDCAKLPATADCIPSDVDHIGADIAFGKDGTLFISTGDGGGHERVEESAYSAQNVDSLAGKILRVTRDGRGLASNPFFAGDTKANRSKVWALGLRNPFRLTLAPGTGLPVVGDVGWRTADEISAAPARANLGWPCFEGRARTPDYRDTDRCLAMYSRGDRVVKPSIELRHNGINSVSGGVFYTGDAYPPEYRDYFYADWAKSWIRHASIAPAGGRLRDKPSSFAADAGGPVAFRMGPDGLLYYLALNFRELYRIEYRA